MRSEIYSSYLDYCKNTIKEQSNICVIFCNMLSDRKMKSNINPGVFFVLLIFWLWVFSYFWPILKLIITDEPYMISDFRKHLVVSVGMSFIMAIVFFMAIYYMTKHRNEVRGERAEKRNKINFQRDLLIFVVAFFFHACFWLFFHFAQSHESFVAADLKKYAVLALSQSIIISTGWYFARKYDEKKEKKDKV